MQIELTKPQQQNLLTFLNRVELKGHEVFAFLEIYAAVAKATEENVNASKPSKQGG